LGDLISLLDDLKARGNAVRYTYSVNQR